MSEKITELIKQVEALVCYSQIYTVKGVQPVNMPDHETAWRKAQQWLWDNCEADEMGNYHLKEYPVGAVWVKATTRLPTPGKITWRWLDRAEAYSGYDEKRGFIYGTGGASVDPTYHTEIEWLDDQPVELKEQQFIIKALEEGSEEWQREYENMKHAAQVLATILQEAIEYTDKVCEITDKYWPKKKDGLCDTIPWVYKGRKLLNEYNETHKVEQKENEAVEFGKWLKHLDNGTTHYNPDTQVESPSIGFSPYDCFIDNIMTVEQLHNEYKKQKEGKL